MINEPRGRRKRAGGIGNGQPYDPLDSRFRGNDRKCLIFMRIQAPNSGHSNWIAEAIVPGKLLRSGCEQPSPIDERTQFDELDREIPDLNQR